MPRSTCLRQPSRLRLPSPQKLPAAQTGLDCLSLSISLGRSLGMSLGDSLSISLSALLSANLSANPPPDCPRYVHLDNLDECPPRIEKKKKILRKEKNRKARA